MDDIINESRQLLKKDTGHRCRSDLVARTLITNENANSQLQAALLIGEEGVYAKTNIPECTVVALYEGTVFEEKCIFASDLDSTIPSVSTILSSSTPASVLSSSASALTTFALTSTIATPPVLSSSTTSAPTTSTLPTSLPFASTTVTTPSSVTLTNLQPQKMQRKYVAVLYLSEDGKTKHSVDAHPKHAQGWNDIAGFINDYRWDVKQNSLSVVNSQARKLYYNVEMMHVCVDKTSKPIIAMITRRNILKDEWLATDYGYSFWRLDD